MRFLALLALGGVAVADITAPSDDKGDTAALLAPWRECATLRGRIPFDDKDPLNSKMIARPRRGGVEVIVASEGSGRDAFGSYQYLQLKRGRCEADGFTVAGPKEWRDGQILLFGWGVPDPSLGEVALRLRGVEVRDANLPELAAARLLLSLWLDDDKPLPKQPEHPGRPTGSPVAVWSPEALQKAGVPLAALDYEFADSRRADGLVTFTIDAPRLLAANDTVEIWELRFRARNGGGILAVYDRARDRHRWLWGTHDDKTGAYLDDESFHIAALDAKTVVVDVTDRAAHRRISLPLR